MTFEKRVHEETARLKKMGLFFIVFSGICSLFIYFLPRDNSIYWLSENGKEGFYVLSGFFFFLGLYCLGAIWRKKHFL